MTSLLEQLPKIVADGKREAERIMERLDSNYRVGLQTRELVIPSRDTNAADMLRMADRASHSLNPADMNRLIYGDNLLATHRSASRQHRQHAPRPPISSVCSRLLRPCSLPLTKNLSTFN